MIKIIALSKDEDKNIRTIEATFSIDNELVPLKVSEEDRPGTYSKIIRLLERPGIDIEQAANEMYDLMSPVAKVKREIDSSYHLSENLSIEDGQIIFGEFVLEDALATHMLSLLDENNTPKDEILWQSYVRFLDNLHQNVNEDIRNQLFKWMEYENESGNAFGITEDGCIVGYKGCGGSILDPKSVFEGTAIVDGVEFTGKIPNKLGSVITMPRSAVQNDPSVGCSHGLHVGTRDYATNWAPILLLVKVNPRDVVSVPYECDSQKMRVCEYTVLKVTDATEEHQRFHQEDDGYIPQNYDGDINDFEMDLSDAHDLMGCLVYIEYDDSESSFEGVVIDVYENGEPGIIMNNNEEYKHIKLHRINYYDVVEDLDMTEDEDKYEDKDGNTEQHEVESDEEYLYVASGSFVTCEELEDLVDERVIIKYEVDKEFEGVVANVYLKSHRPGIVIRSDEGVYKHLKLDRIEVIESVSEDEIGFDSEEDALISHMEEFFDRMIDLADSNNVEQPETEGLYEYIDEIGIGRTLKVACRDGFSMIELEGKLLHVDKAEMQLLIHDFNNGLKIISFEDLISIQVMY